MRTRRTASGPDALEDAFDGGAFTGTLDGADFVAGG